jgi:hypothetical protein
MVQGAIGAGEISCSKLHPAERKAAVEPAVDVRVGADGGKLTSAAQAQMVSLLDELTTLDQGEKTLTSLLWCQESEVQQAELFQQKRAARRLKSLLLKHALREKGE